MEKSPSARPRPANVRGVPAPNARPGERPPRAPLLRPAPAPEPPKPPAPPRELGWLPDCVFTGEKFEAGLAFFVDAQGRITRFTREEKDLAIARRLPGQAALPGLVNAHSHAWRRVARGRTPWREALARAAERLNDEEIFDTARMAFLEMLSSGITCVGEFHELHIASAANAEPNFLSREILRAAHDVGIRVSLFSVANAATGPARTHAGGAEKFLRELEELRVFVEKNFPADEAWLGVGVSGLGAVSVDELKTIATYAHTKRMRLHLPIAESAAEVEAWRAAHGRTPLAWLAERGLVDKRLAAIGAGALTDDEIKTLGAARATVCACPTSARQLGFAPPPAAKLLAAGANLALGSDSQAQIDLLEDARALAPDNALSAFNSATVGGARALGATGGALEVGRPADFFTVNLYDLSVAGAEHGALLANIVGSLERRAIREVWIGGRQLIVGGRHVQQGPIIGRFVEAQRRLWG